MSKGSSYKCEINIFLLNLKGGFTANIFGDETLDTFFVSGVFFIDVIKGQNYGSVFDIFIVCFGGSAYS